MKHPIIITSGGSIQRRDKYSSIISKYLSTSAGRCALAQSMVAPLRTRLDYQGIARKAFAVQQLPQGALPIYDKDPLVSDIVVGSYKYDAIRISSGGIVHRKGRLLKPFLRVTFPQFELYSNPSIKLSDVRARRFDIIDRKVQKARQEIMSQEDSMIFDILDKAGK